MNLAILFIKFITLLLLYLVSAYVLLCGRSKTGINSDYAITAITLLLVLIFL